MLILTWQAAVDNVSLSSNLSYSVYYSENPAFDSVAEVEANGTLSTGPTNALTSHTIKSLTPATRYYVNVIVTDEAGHKSSYLPESFKTDSLKTVTAGWEHSCLINQDGKPYCWGIDDDGALGDGLSAGDQYRPVAVSQTLIAGKKFVSIDANYKNTCALTDSHELWCWGRGAAGAIGHGTNNNQTTPIQIAGNWRFVTSGLTLSSLGDTTVCAINTSGDGYCWGQDNYSKLGNGGSNSNTNSPGLISGGHKWKVIRSGMIHTCGLTEAGKAYCWGDNANKQVGTTSTIADYSTPEPAATEYSFIDIAIEPYSTCGLTKDHKIYCWGDANDGRLGHGSTNETDRSQPVRVIGGHSFKKISSKFSRGICGITTADELYCWGPNTGGVLGDGTTTSRRSPVYIMSNVEQVNANNQIGIALKKDASVWGWGTPQNGSHGLGSNQALYYPSKVATNERAILGSASELNIVASEKDDLTLSWKAPLGATGYVVLRSESDFNLSPEDSKTYTTGDDIAGVKVVYSGSSTSFNDDNLEKDKAYYYKVFSRNTYKSLQCWYFRYWLCR